MEVSNSSAAIEANSEINSAEVNNLIISFPHMANYCVPITFLLKNLFPEAKVAPAPPITKKTLEAGAKHSPDFVCSPFKYNLGNFIEALDNGANVLIQAGGGCRYAFYGELQEQILKDLGYNFQFINLFEVGGLSVFKLYKACKGLNKCLTFFKVAYYLLLTVKMIKYMDGLDFFIRKNIGFEKRKNSFTNLQNEFLARLQSVKTFKDLRKAAKEFDKRFLSIEVEKPDKVLKVGLIGELYNLMEPFANYFIEKELSKNNIQISRYINVTYLMFQKNKQLSKTLKEAGGYLKYHIGAGGTDSVSMGLSLAKNGYDGLIHIKPFGCTPEVNAMPALMSLNRDYKIPILYFSFDSQMGEAGVKTRLEAFYDMLNMRNRDKETSQTNQANQTNQTALRAKGKQGG